MKATPRPEIHPIANAVALPPVDRPASDVPSSSADGVSETWSLRLHLTPVPGKRSIVHLCSGPPREGSYNELAQGRGWGTIYVDICIHPELNIVHDDSWSLLQPLPAHPDVLALQADPQCSSFSALLSRPGGPGPLRAPTGPGRYGLPDLPPARAKKVMADTVLAIRVAALAKAFYLAGKPFIIENPAPLPNTPSIFTLDEYVDLKSLAGVADHKFVQCPFGAYSVKPTLLRYYLATISSDAFPSACPHPVRR